MLIVLADPECAGGSLDRARAVSWRGELLSGYQALSPIP